MRYKPKSWWYAQRDARWAQMRKDGKSFIEIASGQSISYNPEYVRMRIRAWENANG